MKHIRRFSNPFISSPKLIEIEEKKNKKLKKIQKYICLKKLNKGSTGKVYLVQDVLSNEYFALKIYNINKLFENNTLISTIEREIRLLQQFDHPNILKMKEALHSKDKGLACIVLEFANCGSLEDLIISKTILNEELISKIFYQVILGITYLHSKGIVHQDIKPSNLLIFSNGIIKISDFGIGHSFSSADIVVGSPAYQAPELFDGYEENLNEESIIDPTKEDVWSLGISIYESIFLQLPFLGNNIFEIIHEIKNSKLKIPLNTSKELTDLLIKMLEPNPIKRINLNDVKNHPFFINNEKNIEYPFKKIIPPIYDSKINIENISAIICDNNYSFTEIPKEKNIKIIPRNIKTPI